MSKKMKSALGLGKGLGALIPSVNNDAVGQAIHETLHTDDGVTVGVTAMIDIAKVRPNPFQPRQDFDPAALEDLARSIKEKGVIQPITVRRAGAGYELIAGERRVRASIEAGLTKIPAYILDVETDRQMLEIAIIENVQRENLNPIEVARGYNRLMEECSMTQEEVAEKVGKDRSTVTNFLRLLKLPAAIQECLRTKQITMGHARSMLSVSKQSSQVALLGYVLQHDVSVRRTEALAKSVEAGNPLPAAEPEAATPSAPRRKKSAKAEGTSANGKAEMVTAEVAETIGDIESRLRQVFATQVRVRTRSASSGTIELDFFTLDELERILDLLAIIERSQML
jgi:ParB family chromosome partitioning protein